MSNIVGQTLNDQYRVDAYIASGGMGVLFRVWDLKRNVPLAMKVLHADLAEDPKILRRFRREANALKKLTHPNIVPFYGLEQAGDLFFILEAFIDGPSMKEVLRHRQGLPIPIDQVLIYTRALSAALGYAHAHGVVHCDVKPGNVMVDPGGQIYLTDFGIARHAESTTTTLGAAGTPAYMAPEQIRGDALTPATDIYAMGALLFRLLTGQRPFRGDEKGTESAGQTAAERTRYAHIHLPPPSPRRLNLNISENLDQVILKALSKDPEARYQSMQDLFQAGCQATNIQPGAVADRITFNEEENKALFTTAIAPKPIDGQEVPPGIIDRFRDRIGWLVAGGAAILILVFLLLWSPWTTAPRMTHFTIQENPKDDMEIVYVPKGEFTMGRSASSDPYFYGAEGPAHEVYLDGFWIYRTEVTNDMYRLCTDENRCPRPDTEQSNTRDGYFSDAKYGDYPVINVSWKDAAAYCRWAGGRLLTEAEWEKAARGTDRRLFPWGDEPPTHEHSNVNAGDTDLVGSHPEGASPYGVLDMAGNVNEWVFDHFHWTYYSISPEENPRGPLKGSTRVYRGGSYLNDGGAVRAVMRRSRSESHSSVDIGFRCAMDEQPTQTLPIATSSGELSGKIVFTCQITKQNEQNQICLMNADGSEWRQLTNNLSTNHLFPSLSPDGYSIVYVSNQTGIYEIYEMMISGGTVQLTNGLGELNAPAVSPDGSKIVFTNKTGGNTIWVMQRDGSNPREIYGLPQGYGWDPVWSPDGTQILFVSVSAPLPNLSIMNADGTNVRVISNMAGLRGRSDWAVDGVTIAMYAGDSWKRELYLLNIDGTNQHKITDGGNNLAPSFSPDGNWIAFTSYRDRYDDDHGCEIYIMQIDGSEVKRLTNNTYCDWQPRWGP